MSTVVLAPLILWAHWALARGEERNMIEEFGDDYRNYRHGTPTFLPGGRGWRRLLEAVGWAGNRPRFSDRTEEGDA